MRTIIKLLMLLLVAAGIAPFFITGKDGRPLLSLSRLSAPSLPEVSLPTWKKSTEGDSASAPVTVYRWRDDGGTWQFSNSRPPPGIVYETVSVDPNANLLSAPVTTPPRNPSGAQPGEQPSTGGGLPLPLTVSPDKIGRLMDQARSVEAQAKERKATQDRLLDTLQ